MRKKLIVFDPDGSGTFELKMEGEKVIKMKRLRFIVFKR